MKPIIQLLFGLVASLTFAQGYTGKAVLTLPAPGTSSDNKLQVKITVTYSGLPVSDTETTTVAGTLNVALEADPQTGATTGFTIESGNISMSNMNFDFRVLFVGSVATVNTAGMKGTAFTPLPPGVATPTGTGATRGGAPRGSDHAPTGCSSPPPFLPCLSHRR